MNQTRDERRLISLMLAERSRVRSEFEMVKYHMLLTSARLEHAIDRGAIQEEYDFYSQLVPLLAQLDALEDEMALVSPKAIGEKFGVSGHYCAMVVQHLRSRVNRFAEAVTRHGITRNRYRTWRKNR